MAETPDESAKDRQAAIVASRVSSARADVARYRKYDPPGTLDASHDGIIVWLADEIQSLRTRLAEAERHEPGWVRIRPAHLDDLRTRLAEAERELAGVRFRAAQQAEAMRNQGPVRITTSTPPEPGL
ncbi:MAG: hypothetical protein ACR2KM_08775 [Gemmatimonadaceae bacterium]